MFGTGYIIPYLIIFFIILASLLVVAASQLFYRTKPTKALKIGKDGIPFEEHKFYNLLNSHELSRTIRLK